MEKDLEKILDEMCQKLDETQNEDVQKKIKEFIEKEIKLIEHLNSLKGEYEERVKEMGWDDWKDFIKDLFNKLNSLLLKSIFP